MASVDAATAIVSAEDVRFFEENGFLHLKNVIGPAELSSLRTFEEQVSGPAQEATLPSPHYRYATDPLTGRKVLYRIDAAHLRGGAFLEVYGSPTLVSIGEAIFGPNFVPMGLNLVVKRPGYGVSIPWHRDPSGFRLQPGINAGIYFDDATPETGMLYVIPGSHKADYRADLQELIEEHGFHIPGAIPVPAKAGDVVVHSENVLHGSRVVRGQRTRRVLYYCFRSIEEQLSRGGKYTPSWAQFMIRTALHAGRVRAASEIGRDETPYRWKLAPEYQVSLQPDEFVEMWIEG
jgi:ectoine hydroxylase-related dioxygenase (phytanoyl-CoA dioxygenase family)